MAGMALSGIRPRRFHASHTAFSTASHASIRSPLAPNCAHFGTGIALDHCHPLAPFASDSLVRTISAIETVRSIGGD